VAVATAHVWRLAEVLVLLGGRGAAEALEGAWHLAV